MTERLVNAISNPFTTWIGHLSGRLLLKREPFDFSLDAVLDACQEHGVGLEINANPRRLDIDWRHIPAVRKRGIDILICPDAHSIEGVDDIDYGVSIARKGGLAPSNIMNCMPLAEFEAYLSEKKPT